MTNNLCGNIFKCEGHKGKQSSKQASNWVAQNKLINEICIKNDRLY